MEMQRTSRLVKEVSNSKSRKRSSAINPAQPFSSVFPLNLSLHSTAAFENPREPFSVSSILQNPDQLRLAKNTLRTHQSRISQTNELSLQGAIPDFHQGNRSNYSNLEPTQQNQTSLKELLNKMEKEVKNLEALLPSSLRKNSCKTKTGKNRHCKESVFCQSLRKEKEEVFEQVPKTKPIRKIQKKQQKQQKDHFKGRKDKNRSRREKRQVVRKQVAREKQDDSSTICKSKNFTSSDEGPDQQRETGNFLESQGKIRKGTEFQNQVPELSEHQAASIHLWLERKRESLLFREINSFYLFEEI